MSRTCSLCNEDAAWGVIDKFGFMHPGTLCPQHFVKWKRAAWEPSFIFLRLPGSRAVVEEWNRQKQQRITIDEASKESEPLFLQERMAKTMAEVKRDAIIEAIEAHDCNVQRATSELGISKASMYRAIKRFGIVLRRSIKEGKEDPY